MLKYRRRLMREYIMPVIASLIILTAVLWFCIMSFKVVDCDNYEFLTKTETVMIKGKCYKYVDGQLQIVKELE